MSILPAKGTPGPLPASPAFYESIMRDEYMKQKMAAMSSAIGSVSIGSTSAAPTGDVSICIHPTANGYTITLQGDATRKEWVCPDGVSIVDIIAVALAEFNLTK